MGKTKIKRGRSHSSSSSSSGRSGRKKGRDCANSKTLIERLARVEAELARRSSSSRSRSRPRFRRTRSPRSDDRGHRRSHVKRSRSPAVHHHRSQQRSDRKVVAGPSRRSSRDIRSRSRSNAKRPQWSNTVESRVQRPQQPTKDRDAVLPRPLADDRLAENDLSSVCNTTANSDVCSVCSVSEVIDDNSNDNQDVLEVHNDVSLPDDVLELLGDDPENKLDNSFSLHESLVSRWNALLRDGLKKEDCASRLNKYEIPSNLNSLTPPKLNPEVKAALLKSNLVTDSSYSEEQNQLSKGICALGKGISSILGNVKNLPEDLKGDLLSSLLDSGRILTNLFHRVTVTRKNLIIPHLKNMKQLADKSTDSEYLFGTDLSEKLKSFKNIETVSKELKLTSNAGKNTPFYRK
ncbi:unnamed protein product [Ceutorhynchus assimilis]|uniref:Uncharacterized protein n=1 Tax=Ceutorhynchus assimilis TaxID=467358 RepID=A0A9N9MXU8_9CUCU|nr:unnamed protein product [Ceutorhynchus assimilis]